MGLDLIVAFQAVILVCMAVALKSSSSAGLLGVSLNNVLCKFGSDRGFLSSRRLTWQLILNEAFSNSLSSVISGWAQLEVSLGSISRVKNFEDQVTPEDRDNEKNDPPPNWPARGAISFHGVNAFHG